MFGSIVLSLWATSIVTRNRVRVLQGNLGAPAYVSTQSQRLVTSMLGLQCDFLGSHTRQQERQGLACDVGPSSHSLSTVPRPRRWWDEGLGYKDRALPRLGGDSFIFSFLPSSSCLPLNSSPLDASSCHNVSHQRSADLCYT
jgi:hypothetical protein